MIENSSYIDKVRQFYDANAQKEWDRLFVDQSHQIEYHVTTHYLDKYLPSSGTSRVLDVGGGAGRYTISLAKKGYRMSLVDISGNALTLAREKVAEFNVGDKVEQIAQVSVTDLSLLLDNPFDAVIAIGGVLSHLITPHERKIALAELKRVAKPDAPIFLSVMSRFGEIGNRLIRNPEDVEHIDRFLEDGNHLRPETGVFTHTYFYTPDELTNLLLEAGLEIQEMVSVESISTPLKEHVNNLPEDLFQKWVSTFIKLSSEQSLLGISSHFMIIARNPKRN